jgi:hypothetical protein
MEQGRIENGFYVQGDVKFVVDIKDAHKTFDAVAALSNVDKIKLAKLNGIQAEPYNKQALTTILKSVLQNAWYVATTGNLPTEVVTAHNARLAQYATTIALPSSAIDFLSKKTRATSTARPSLKYVIDEAKYEADFKNWRGQGYLVIKSMLDLGATGTTGKSVRDIFENIKETRETSAPTRNGVGQYVNKLIAAGIATCLNPQDAKQKATKVKATTSAQPAKHTPPPPAKKKH